MKKHNSGARLALSLALITVLGPSGIDMYLPSMPDMAKALSTSFSNIQLSLTVFLMAMGLGQLIFGPVVDAYGRRRPLLLGLVAFIAGAVLSAQAGTVEHLLYARFLQGLAAAMTLVVAMSTVRDLSEGATAARLFALLMTIEGLAPVLAPTIGGALASYYSWHAVMYLLAAMGALALANTFFNLPESLPRDKRSSMKPGSVCRTYSNIFRDAGFLLPALALSSAFFFLFAYIGGAGLVYQREFGLTPSTFGTVFGITGLAVLLGAMASARLVASWGIARLAKQGVTLMLVGACVSALAAFADLGLFGVAAGMFIAMFGLGIAESTLMSIAMSSQQTALGSTAALLGGMQLTIASLATPLAAWVADMGAREWTVTLVLIGAGVLGLAIRTTRAMPDDVQVVMMH